tara:strand:- start:198 stop:452 length:255 start_codon:yes stop_codon:yes gene_type:complete
MSRSLFTYPQERFLVIAPVISYMRAMKSKEINKTIERLDNQDWKRMKKHLDKKYPSMKLPTVKDFKELVKLYGKFREDKEKILN